MLHLVGDFVSGSDGPIFLTPRDVVLPVIYCDSMPTAICVFFSSEGFVLGADGMGNDGSDLAKYSEQKIFPTDCPSWNLAYGLSGLASVVDDETGADIFKEECQRIVEELKIKNPPDLGHYADYFAFALGEFVQKRLSKDGLAQGQSSALHFAGYFKTFPAMAKRTLRFLQSGVIVSEREDKMPPRLNDYFVVGSQKVARLLLDPNANEFDKYKSSGFKKMAENSVLSMQEALELATNYIAACSTDKARELDPYCKTIGGQTSIATITQTEGFRWLEPSV
jgi:hypothetical protein